MHHNLIIKDGDVTKVEKQILVDGVQFVDKEPIEGSDNLARSGSVAETNKNLSTQSNNIAEAFSASSTYAIGEVVVGPDGKLYQCTTAVETAGEWDATDWTQTTIPEVIDDKIDEVTLDPSAVAFGNVHLLDELTELPADGTFLVDSATDGPGQMPKDTLLGITTKEAVDAVNANLDKVIVYPNKSLSFDELPNIQTLLNTNIEPETSVAKLAAYDLGTYNTYYFYAQNDVEVYFDDDVISNANYLSVAYGTSPSGTWVPVPDSTSNRRYMQCSVVARKRKSNNDLPTSNAKLTIPAGSIIAFTQRNTDSATVNINCYPELSPSLPAPEPKKMKIEYVSSDSYKISFGDYECELYRVVNEAADADNWNVVHISHNGSDITGRWTDIIGPLKISGDDDFIGGAHGSETTNSLNVYSGSKKLTLDSSLDEEFEKLTIMMTSTCRRESDKSNAFSRRVCVEISKNKMHISSEFVCIASSSLTVTRVTNGGLISANNNVILGCYMNNYSCDGYPLAAPNNQSNKNTHAVVVTTHGTIVVNNIQGKEQDDYKGYFELFATEEVPRTKVYFCPLYSTGTSVSEGDAFYGECEYTFQP